VHETRNGSKTSAVAEAPTSISRFALENGVEHVKAMSFMRRRGLLLDSDPRCLTSTNFAKSPLVTTTKAFLAEVDHYHRKVVEWGIAMEPGPARSALKGSIAMQKKLIQATRLSGDHAGFSAGALAMSFEDSGLAIQGRPGCRRLGKRLFEVSAGITDRVVLNERCAFYEGLVSEFATSSRQGFRAAVNDLGRIGKIDRADPRTGTADTGALDQYHTNEFLAHTKASLWRAMPKTQKLSNSPYSRTNIVQHVADLPGRGNRPDDQILIDQRDAAFMKSVAGLCERVAMNLALTGSGQKSEIAGLLAISSSACQRHRAYEARVRQNTNEAEVGAGRKKKRDDLVL